MKAFHDMAKFNNKRKFIDDYSIWECMHAIKCLMLRSFLFIYIAVLLEKFSIFYNDEETKLCQATMKDFKKKWRKFDLQAKV